MGLRDRGGFEHGEVVFGSMVKRQCADRPERVSQEDR
jgi:hypothetical protein